MRSSYLYTPVVLVLSLGAHLAFAQTHVPLADPFTSPCLRASDWVG